MGEVVDGNLHGLAIPQRKDMLDEQVGFERVGVVEIDFGG